MSESKMSPAQWDEAKSYYEAGVPVSEIARRFPITRTAINKRATRHGWIKGSESAGVTKLTGDTILGVRGVTDETRRDEIIGKVADERAGLIIAHRKSWTILDELQDEIVRCLRDKDYLPPTWPIHERTLVNEAGEVTALKGAPVEPFDHEARKAHTRFLQQTYRTLAEGMTTKQEGQRRSYGFDYKMQADSGAKDEAADRRRQEMAKGALGKLDELKPLLAKLEQVQLPAPPAQG